MPGGVVQISFTVCSCIIRSVLHSNMHAYRYSIKTGTLRPVSQYVRLPGIFPGILVEYVNAIIPFLGMILGCRSLTRQKSNNSILHTVRTIMHTYVQKKSKVCLQDCVMHFDYGLKVTYRRVHVFCGERYFS